MMRPREWRYFAAKFSCVCIFFIGNSCQAEAVYSDGRIIVSGFIGKATVNAVREILIDKKVHDIVFKNSFGGNVGGALSMVELIESNKFDTAVSGQCHSSCAIAFMAGTHRRYINQGVMQFHMSRPRPSTDVKKNTPEINQHFREWFVRQTNGKETNQHLSDWLIRRTDGKINKFNILSMIEKSKEETSGVIFLSRKIDGVEKFSVRYCDGSEGGKLSACKEIVGANPYDLGIFTP